MTTKSAAYWEGRRAEAERLAAGNGRSPSVAELAQQVALAINRDEGRKRALVARSPGVFAAMDGNQLGEASSIELAMRELKALGIEPGDNDPLAILDAHHMGRKFARDSDLHIPGNRLAGGNTLPGAGGTPLVGSARDAREGGSLSVAETIAARQRDEG